MSLYFFYPQFKKLTGAERLILKLATYTAQMQGREVVLLTHSFTPECRPALGPGVRLVETGWRMQWTGSHYLDAAIEYALGPALALRLPKRGLSGVVFFGPPSVPAMWFTRQFMRVALPRRPLLYFCFEPPRFIYSDTEDVAVRVGKMGWVVRALAAIYRRLDRRMVDAADAVLSNSPYGARKILHAYGKRAAVIEHGVDFMPPSVDEVAALRERYALGNRSVAVTVNHLHPRKRIDLFLRAMRFAGEFAPDTVALVVGGGPEEAELKKLASALGFTLGHDAVFTGAVPESELPAHYALGDVYCHTGREESFGLSVIEALWSGLPVVSVNEGGPRDTVQDGKSGYLTDPTPEALGEALGRLLVDRERAAEMGREGSRFVAEHYRWERGAQSLLAGFTAISARLRGKRVARPVARVK